MEAIRITLCRDGITTIMQVTANRSTSTSKFHHREYPLQGVLHCYGVLDRENDRTACIYGKDIKQLKQMAYETAKRLFGKG